jgi:hypothetical protein
VLIIFGDVVLGIGNVDVDAVRRGAMMSVYLVVIDDSEKKLVGRNLTVKSVKIWVETINCGFKIG